MTTERERSEGLHKELEGPDQAGYSSTKTGAGGELARNADRPPGRDIDADVDETPAENDESVIGHAGSGGSAMGFVAPPPGTDWPDPMGGDDEERELERRTR